MKSPKQEQFSTQEHIKYLRNLHQQGPRIGNAVLEDEAFREYLQWIVPRDKQSSVKNSLSNLSDLMRSENVIEWCNQVERVKPTLEQFSAWGERIDKLYLTNGWREMH